MRKHLIIVVTVALGALTAVAFAQDPSPEEAERLILDALSSSSGAAAEILANQPRARPPALQAGAWEITTRTLRSNCPQEGVAEVGYTGTLSRSGARYTIAVPTSPNWKTFNGELLGNSVVFTAYQEWEVVRARFESSPQRGVFHIVAHEVGPNTLEGYGFRSVWLASPGRRGGVLCDASLAVRLRKL